MVVEVSPSPPVIVTVPEVGVKSAGEVAVPPVTDQLMSTSDAVAAEISTIMEAGDTASFALLEFELK
jgi:hypothetical protein